MTRSEELFAQAKRYIPGGVNSPVRDFSAVGQTPLFIKNAEGAYIVDVDDKKYIDYVGSWGPMILGHNHPAIREAVQKAIKNGLSFGAPCEEEVHLAELITTVTRTDMVRMVNSGTEAVMSALRLARGYTKRSKIIKFEGCYHGHSDSMLVKSGSGVLTAGIAGSAGVPEATVKDTLNAVYNDIDSVKLLFRTFPQEIAAVIIEPVAANMGVILPVPGFLEELRELCTAYGALLIFDEVITGFRLALGGAREYFGVSADLVTYGKIIGGGLPVGAYAGRQDIMEHIAPMGTVYQAGTLSGNPVAMAAGVAQITWLKEHLDIYQQLLEKAQYFSTSLLKIAKNLGVELTVNQVGSLCCPFFARESVSNFTSAQKADTKQYAVYFREMLNRGVYLAPSQFEAMFFSDAHLIKEIDSTIEAAKEAIEQVQKECLR